MVLHSAFVSGLACKTVEFSCQQTPVLHGLLVTNCEFFWQPGTSSAAQRHFSGFTVDEQVTRKSEAGPNHSVVENWDHRVDTSSPQCEGVTFELVGLRLEHFSTCTTNRLGVDAVVVRCFGDFRIPTE